MQGRVKWFNPEKGFGFIISSEGQDVFVHYSQIRVEGYKTLENEQLVEFEVYKAVRGLQAHNVVKI